MTIADLIADAFRELRVLNAVDPPTGEESTLGLLRFNKLLDNKNAERLSVYAQKFDTYVLTPSLSPHTIGPTGTWVTAQRPESIESADLITTGAIYTPIDVDHEADWYASLPTPGLTSVYPSDLYYEKAWPNGKLFFYPIGLTAYSVRLQSRVVLASVAVADTFSLPPGYQDLLTLELAEDCASPLGVSFSPESRDKLLRARARVTSANQRIPRLVTKDSGMPGSSSDGGFDYRSRTF